MSAGEFFAIDAEQWAQCFARGMGINVPVAYLVLARFTARDNRTTTASTNAIEVHTRIARSRARAAVDALIKAGLVTVVRAGARPKYRLGGERKSLIWLPNTLVTGAANETSPVERIRQAQDPMTLRLFVELYGAQNLREDGGVPRHLLRGDYTRHRLGERGAYAIWGFAAAQKWATLKAPILVHHREPTADEKKAGKNAGADIFARLATLEALHLVDWVPHIIEADTPDAETILSMGERGVDIEGELLDAASLAAETLMTDWGSTVAERHALMTVPLPKHLSAVQCVGVLRLRYRPRTALTGAWWAHHQAKSLKWLALFQEIARTGSAKAVG